MAFPHSEDYQQETNTIEHNLSLCIQNNKIKAVAQKML
jgi:hypothetical protein